MHMHVYARQQHRLRWPQPAPRVVLRSLPLCPSPAPPLPRRACLQRKRLEPFEVPKSGAFWLHDDRYAPGDEDAGDAAGREAKGEGEELDERQK